jgi:hypothetical protein
LSFESVMLPAVPPGRRSRLEPAGGALAAVPSTKLFVASPQPTASIGAPPTTRRTIDPPVAANPPLYVASATAAKTPELWRGPVAARLEHDGTVHAAFGHGPPVDGVDDFGRQVHGRRYVADLRTRQPTSRRSGSRYDEAAGSADGAAAERTSGAGPRRPGYRNEEQTNRAIAAAARAHPPRTSGGRLDAPDGTADEF